MHARALFALLLLLAGSLAASAQSAFTRNDWPSNQRRDQRQSSATLAAPPSDDPGFGPIPERPPQEIVGGGNASTYPWMATLVDKRSASLYNGRFCGASLVHPQWVLTAAHCVEGLDAADLDVAIGGTDLDSSASFQRIPVAEIVPHPHYNALNSNDDAALLRLAWAASGGNAATISLADRTALETAGTSAKILGWGSTDSGGKTYPKLLQEGTVPLVDFNTANTAYGGILTDNMLAAGGTGKTDFCHGDTGGPLAVHDPALQRWMLTGIVSFGDACAQTGVYGVYSRISALRPFVMRHISPGYAAWEAARNVTGRLRDPDGDRRDNWSEFLAASDPLSPGPPPFPSYGFTQLAAATHPTVALRVPAYCPELEVLADFAPDSLDQAWQALDPAQHLLSTVANPDGTATLTWRSPAPHSGQAGFFRTTTRDTGSYRFATRSFALQSAVAGSLTTADPLHPALADTRQHLYAYQPGGEAGSQVKVFLRSQDFDSRLELLDSAGAVLQTATIDAALGLTGKDESILFTPEAGTSYQLRVTSESPGQTGRYTLGGYQVAAFSALPAAPTSTTAGNLATNTPFDPLLEPGGGYHHKDYRLNALAASGWRMFALSSTVFDAVIVVIDAETGFATGWRDDDSGGGTIGLNARLRFRAIAGHDYILRCSTFRPGETGNFTVQLTTTSQPNLVPGGSSSGSLSLSDDRDYLGQDGAGNALHAQKDTLLLSGLAVGSQVTVSMTSPAVPGSYFNTYLRLRDPVTGLVVAENDDISATNYNSRIVFTARRTEYVITATSSQPEITGNYTVTASSP